MEIEDDWVAMIEPREGREYECKFCFDYGGLMLKNASYDNGEPVTQTCWHCQTPSDLD